MRVAGQLASHAIEPNIAQFLLDVLVLLRSVSFRVVAYQVWVTCGLVISAVAVASKYHFEY